MPLRFHGTWRFTPPADGHFVNSSIPEFAVGEFSSLIDKIPAPQGRWEMLEHFKRHFGGSSWSSSESWAVSDLQSAMSGAAGNAPMFIENFYDACEALRARADGFFVPDAANINVILSKYNIGYELRPPDLVARELGGTAIPVQVRMPTLAERSRRIIEQSLIRSEELLAEGRPREAVQEILWVLETVATAFRGLETESGKVEGKYFNQIVRDLRAKRPGTTLERALEWVTSMHGYLSSPTGGGVRHGVDLDSGVALGMNEARLFCNLTRSYVHYLLGDRDGG